MDKHNRLYDVELGFNLEGAVAILQLGHSVEGVDLEVVAVGKPFSVIHNVAHEFARADVVVGVSFVDFCLLWTHGLRVLDVVDVVH